MIIRTVVILAAYAVIALGQTAPSPAKKGGQYQRPASAGVGQEKEDFLTSSTKLVNKSDLDYGAMFEQRRQAFLAASGANPFFWYSALTTAILMVLMFAYGVRVMDEKRKLWHAAEILNDVWNHAQYARATAEDAIGRHNAHMETCNRVIEAQASGRPSPAALETTDARNELARVRGELDNIDSERKLLKAKLDEKEKLVDDLSARLKIVVKTSHFGSNRSYGLAKAILLYSDGQEAFATVHEPKKSPDGGPPYLDAGEPLTVDFLRQLAKGLGQTVAREILPANVLARTPDMLVWWTRPQRRVMFFSDSSDGRTLSGHMFPQPPLVFRVCGSELAVRALAENKRPRSDTALMFAPYWNCDGGGRVCQGSMRTPGKLCLEAMKPWERAFFESEFTHAAIGARLTTHPEGFLGLWRDLADSEATFPGEFLVKSVDTLGAFVQGRED